MTETNGRNPVFHIKLFQSLIQNAWQNKVFSACYATVLFVNCNVENTLDAL